MARQRETKELLRELSQTAERRTVFVLGETDTGKTTLVSEIAKSLLTSSEVVWIDGDPGQSVIGPPATVGSALLSRGSGSPRSPGGSRGGTLPEKRAQEVRLRFVGGVSPVRHLLQMTVGIGGLVRAARRDHPDAHIVVDSCGFVTGPVAEEFQYSLIDLLRPDILVILDRGSAVHRIAASFAGQGGPRIAWVRPPRAVRKRNTEERAAYRKRRLAHYFADMVEESLSLGDRGIHGHVPREQAAGGYDSGWKNRLVAFLDAEQFVLSLGVVEDAEPGEHLADLSFRLKLPADQEDAPKRAASIQVGSTKLEGVELLNGTRRG
ncbi:MAG: Clp1/GlmU family protein [Spirochaetota bacterium]